jgi:hypothetical protein
MRRADSMGQFRSPDPDPPDYWDEDPEEEDEDYDDRDERYDEDDFDPLDDDPDFDCSERLAVAGRRYER